MSRKSILSVTLLLSVQGCALVAQQLSKPENLRKGSSCAMVISTRDAERCIAANNYSSPVPKLDSSHTYTLAELIDIAETANPEGRIAWAEAKAALERAGIARSSYLPLLTFVAEGSDERAIVPFPEPIAPRGYVTVEAPTATAQLQLQYSLLNFRRGAELDGSKALEVASALRLARVHQTIAHDTAVQFYQAQEAVAQLVAAQTILKTAETVESSAREQYANGRATLPDVQNAEAGAAEARYDLASTEGEVKKKKLTLTETMGVEPTTEITVVPQDADAPETFEDSVEQFIESAKRVRPDLIAYSLEVKHNHDLYRAARASYLPSVGVSASGGQTSTWPSADFGVLGHASVSTWSATAELKWNVFDGARRHQVAEAVAEEKASVERQRAAGDAATRQVWGAYVDYQTAIEQERASQAFLQSAQTSYDSSLDAFGYGVRSLVDVVQAEKQLAQARFTVVRARARRQQSEIELSYSTGDLLSGGSRSGIHP
jgi:outer membrane protein